MSAQLHALTHGWSGLVFIYSVVQVPMLIGLVQGRASIGKLLRSPVTTVLAMLAVGIVTTIADPLLRRLGLSDQSPLHLYIDVAASVAIGYATGRWVASRSSSSISYRRGAIASQAYSTPAAQPSRRSRRGAGGVPDPNTPVTLAGIAVAAEDETKHFKLVGTTGTGDRKSVV